MTSREEGPRFHAEQVPLHVGSLTNTNRTNTLPSGTARHSLQNELERRTLYEILESKDQCDSAS